MAVRSEFDERRERLLPGKGIGFSNERGYQENEIRANKCGCLGWLCRGNGDGVCKNCNDFMATLFNMGRTDRRTIHFGIKMGVALASVSCLTYWRSLKEDLNKYSVWAILTVIVCFEYSVGATLSRGLNRGFGTVAAGALAFGMAELASKAGEFTEPLIIISIFLAGASASYIKLHPLLKAYEYGFRSFLMTFCIVMVNGNRTTFLHTALFRFILIIIGAGIGSLVNLFIFPIWAGEDLHKLVAKNFNGVATSLEGCVDGYLQCVAYERIPSMILTSQAYDDPLYGGYRTAVYSFAEEEILLDFATWEPPHGRYRMFKYPWQNYVKVSGALRYCAFMVMALHGCVLSEIQAPAEKRRVFAKELHRVGTVGAKVLRELGSKVEKMEKLNPGDILAEVHEAAEELQMKIDRKSYILVHAEKWEESVRPKEFEDPERVANMVNKECCEYGNQSVIDSLSESGQSFEREHSLNALRGRPELFSSESLANRTEWPSQRSPYTSVSEQEEKTLESASSLSLATVASILVEFVARLGYLVKAFEELSELAHFKEPTDQFRC